MIPQRMRLTMMKTALERAAPYALGIAIAFFWTMLLLQLEKVCVELMIP